jgi:hypothetical protein
MAKEIINIGAVPDDPSADTVRAAFGKLNTNFSAVWNNPQALDLVAEEDIAALFLEVDAVKTGADLSQMQTHTAAQFAVLNPILRDGELGYESDSGRVKIGNGLSYYNDLLYSALGAMGYKVVSADSYTLLPEDVNATIRFTAGNPVVVSVHPETMADVPVGSSGLLVQAGSGQVEFTGTNNSNLIIESEDGRTKTIGQYAVMGWMKIANDRFLLTGAITL